MRKIKRNIQKERRGNLRKLLLSTGLALAFSISLTSASYSQIVPDGRTNTTLTTVGNVTDVGTTTVSGVNAFNSFSQFNVNAGTTVNLNLPASTQNLINLVSQGPSQIAGILNSMQNGQVGGNVFLLNPQGIMVSTSGQINVGSLTALTPTRDFVDNFFDAPGIPNEGSVTALLSGKAPINSGGAIVNRGEINAPVGVEITAGSITNAGVISTNIGNIDIDENLGELVNLTMDKIRLEEGSRIIVPNGAVALNRLTNGDVTIFNESEVKALNAIESKEVNIGTSGTIENLTIRTDLEMNKSLSISARKNIRISTMGIIKAKNIKAGNDIFALSAFSGLKAENIEAGGDIEFRLIFLEAGDISAGKSIDITAPTCIVGNVIANENIAIRANDDVLSKGFIRAGDIVSGKNIFLRAFNLETKNIIGAENIEIVVTPPDQGLLNKLTTENILSFGNITISGQEGEGKKSNVEAKNIAALGDISIADFDEVKLKNMASGQNIEILANNILTDDIWTGKDTSLSSAGIISTGNIYTGNNLTAGNIIDGTIEKAKQVTTENITTGKDLTLAANKVSTGVRTAGGIITIIEDLISE